MWGQGICLIKGPYETFFLLRRSFRWNISHSLGSLCSFSTSVVPAVWSQVRHVRIGPTQTYSQGVDVSFTPYGAFLLLQFCFFLVGDVFPLMKEKSFSSLNLCFCGPEFWMVEIISIKPCAPELAYISGPILRIVTKFRNDPHGERFQCTVTIHTGEES